MVAAAGCYGLPVANAGWCNCGLLWAGCWCNCGLRWAVGLLLVQLEQASQANAPHWEITATHWRVRTACDNLT